MVIIRESLLACFLRSRIMVRSLFVYPFRSLFHPDVCDHRNAWLVLYRCSNSGVADKTYFPREYRCLRRFSDFSHPRRRDLTGHELTPMLRVSSVSIGAERVTGNGAGSELRVGSLQDMTSMLRKRCGRGFSVSLN